MKCKPCVNCKHYKAEMCNRYAYVDTSPVTGLEVLKGRVDATKEREANYLEELFKVKCGRNGYFFSLNKKF